MGNDQAGDKPPGSSGNGIADIPLLPGLKVFYRDTNALVSGTAATTGSFVLLNIEIDNLEFVLRRFGPAVRNKVTGKVGATIAGHMNKRMKLYHIAQFRYCLLLLDTSFKHAMEMAKNLVEKLEKTIHIQGVDFCIDIKIGIVHYPHHAKTVNELVRMAAFASHTARINDRDYATFDEKIDAWEQYQLQLLTDIKTALANQSGIRLALQPIVDLRTGECRKVEGLCRWKHDTLGEIAPDHFLPFVEQSSLIYSFTDHTIELGLGILKNFACNGRELDIAINLSTSVFRNPELAGGIIEQLNFFSIDPARVVFEITETNIMSHPRGAIHILSELRKLGCKVAIDDFGTGHSSLSYIADLPIDIIKIDKCFIRDLDQPQNEAILCAAASLANKLELETVAEGIENDAQYRKCAELGIRFGQGFHIGKPMFEEQFNAWQTAHKPGKRSPFVTHRAH